MKITTEGCLSAAGDFIVCSQKQHKLVVIVEAVCCLTFQQRASSSQGRICSKTCTCCYTETEVADQTFYLTQLRYTDTASTSPSADHIKPGTWQCSDTASTGPSADHIKPGIWQCSHWGANFSLAGMTRGGGWLWSSSRAVIVTSG